MSSWPDALETPDPHHMAALLREFWQTLGALADLLPRGELVLGEEAITHLRRQIIEMMLAANGIAWPQGTRHLNGYLGESQRIALERTLVAEGTPYERIVARAVALVTIYRWYAPQLVEKFSLPYPVQEERTSWAALVAAISEWPESLETA